MVAVRSVLALTLLRWRLHPVTNSPLRPIASSATSNNTWNVLAWAILCLRVSCTSSTTSLVLQNLNNLLSSGQEELKQSTVMPSELKKFLMLCHWLPSKERLSIKWCSHAYRKRDRTWWQSKWRLNNWSQHGRYNSSFEIPLSYEGYAAHDVLKAEVKKAKVRRNTAQASGQQEFLKSTGFQDLEIYRNSATVARLPNSCYGCRLPAAVAEFLLRLPNACYGCRIPATVAEFL